jgi:hypothetical protein
VPAAIALAVVEATPWLVSTRRIVAPLAIAGTLALAAAGVASWKDEFDGPERTRAALASRAEIRAPVLVANAAAWRYDLDGAAIVTPADGIAALQDVARRYGARTLVLEPGHFSALDALYDGREGFDWLIPVQLDGPVRIWRIELR